MARKLTPNASIAVAQLGEDIQTARRRRRLRQKDLAAKMGVSVSTVRRLESGDAGITVGNLAMAFIALGCLEQLRSALDPEKDSIGLLSDSLEQPQRIRVKKRPAWAGGASLNSADDDDATPLPL